MTEPLQRVTDRDSGEGEGGGKYTLLSPSVLSFIDGERLRGPPPDRRLWDAPPRRAQ